MPETIKQLPRVLLIDNDPAILQPLGDQIKRLPAEVDTVTTGNDAIDLFLKAAVEKKPFRLVILDMWIPHNAGEKDDAQGGLETLLAVKHFHLVDPKCYIIIFTAHESYKDCVSCIKSHAVDYIPKVSDEGIGPEDVLDRCRRLLYPKLEDDPFEAWAATNMAAARARYDQKVVALFRPEAAQAAGLEGELLDGYIIVPRDTQEEIGMLMLNSKILRWERPMLINYREI
jgi:CheY-like chemotaxis protein